MNRTKAEDVKAETSDTKTVSEDDRERARKEAEEKAAKAKKEAEEKAAKEAGEKAAKEAEEKAAKEAEEKAARARKEAEEKAAKEAEEKAAKARKEAEEKAAKEAEEKAAKEAAKDAGKSLNDGLKATRSEGFLAQIGRIFRGDLKQSVIEELEDILYTADIGVQTSERLLDRVRDTIKDRGDGAEAMAILRNEVRDILHECEKPFEIGNEGPHVILTIGVNGAGKTTTLGKLAAKLTHEGKKVLLIAGDTFRAAAIEQLEEWSQRCGCGFFSRKQGADPSGTIFDGIKYAKENGYDVALADTAGRLHNKKDLVEELKKIHRVSGKAHEGAPHQVILVLDATNGQNALMQAKEFGAAIDFTGIILTKLDGTAKGGVIIGICEEFRKPVYFIGIGEMVDDLRRFEADEFVDALFLDTNGNL